ncbi:DUF7561 family protein [Halapricum hydrolyticum]|uniref:Small CPxCG-related zinc finger protein n=1 Tax=Halapricum hydrolyticum TaxID=2979991 RepID=A0AAE3IED6_9EURY|nr:hypothetical protein [Halapricum hydrolyticum]MCU4718746.1 hypothetical protein [Halapricum hydrolyticum]MCU4727733.1 hypothetical protein [Halapricum hydrolyticum]
MSTQRCDGCNERTRIAGGISDFWSQAGGSSGGVTLELADGSEHFLCFECVERLPEDRAVTAADIKAL